MAEIEKHRDRETWIRWAREFIRRGLWPADIITIHGPHPYPLDFHWGETYCRPEWSPKRFIEIEFHSRRPCRKYFVGNVVMENGGRGREKEIFPLLKSYERSKRGRRWLRVAERVLKNYTQERQKERQIS